MTDLERAYKALNNKQRSYQTLTNYYTGDQPLKYSAERLREAFENPQTRFIQNWCAVVIDSVLDRLTFKGWDSEDDAANDLLDAFYIDNKIQLISHNVHKNALITGEGFIIFDKVDAIMRAFYNDSRNVHLFYDDNGNKRFGAKWWVEEETRQTRLNLYYPDRIIKYKGMRADETYSVKSMELSEEVENPFAEIPIIHFKTGYSELTNIVYLQDAVNKILSDMMVVGEFNAFNQRWIVTNADMSTLRSSPKTMFQIPKGEQDLEDTKIGTFPAANLTMFLDAMDKLANSIAIISRTPKHYFMSTGAAISGEALIVMESPLVKKIQQIQENYSDAWIETANFILSQNNMSAGVSLVWSPLETIQPLMRAQEMKALRELGIPLKTILRRAGWGEDEIAQYESDTLEEKQNKASETSLLLEEIRRRQAQNNII